MHGPHVQESPGPAVTNRVPIVVPFVVVDGGILALS